MCVRYIYARPRPANCRRSCRPSAGSCRPSAGSNRRRFSPAGSVPKRWRKCGGSPPSCRSTLPLPWAEPFAGAGLLRGFAGLLPVCYRFAAGRHALNRFCVAPDLRRICLVPTCLVPTCLVPTCLVPNLLCVAPAFAEPPLCRGLLCGVPQLVPAPRALPDVAKNNCRE